MKNSRNKLLEKKENIYGFIFILPGLLGFLVFVLFPVVFSLVLSFQDWSFTQGFDKMKFIGLENYSFMFSDKKFIVSIVNTLLIAITTVPVTLIFGLVFAYWIKEYVYGKVIVRTMMFIPYVSSIVAVSIVFMVLLHPSYGPVNQVLTALGVENPPKWFGDPWWALPSIVMLTIWLNIGYYIVVYMAGFTNIPISLYEAAEIDGANGIKKFLHVTVPGVSPTTFFLLIIGIINAFKIFDQIIVTTAGGPGTSTYVLAVYIYQLAFTNYRMGYASAVAWAMLIIIMIVTLIQWKYQNKKVDYMM